MPETWSFWATISEGIIHQPSRSQKSFLSKSFDFEAIGDDDAKKIILVNLKRFVRKVKTMRGRRLMIFAAPCLKQEGERRALDGDRLIRLKIDFSSNKKILKITRPDNALVQGYGPEALKKLGLG